MVSYGTAALGTIGLTAPCGAALEPTGEDGELMARLASGDTSALGVLYDRYGAQALGLARRILGDAEAEVWRDLASRLDRRRVVEALRSLPPVQREAIELAFFDGLSHVEIAEQLDLPLGTVAGRIRLGLAKLRGLIEESLAR